jgi:hypothetical protein
MLHASRTHRIGNEDKLLSFHAMSQPKMMRMGMHQVGNDIATDIRTVKTGTDDPRLSVVVRGHRVEKVGHMGDTGIKTLHALGIVSFGVPYTQDDVGSDTPHLLHESQTTLHFRCQCDHANDIEVGLKPCCLRKLHEPLILRPVFGGVDEGSLQVHTDYLRTAQPLLTMMHILQGCLYLWL